MGRTVLLQLFQSLLRLAHVRSVMQGLAVGRGCAAVISLLLQAIAELEVGVGIDWA